MDRDVASTFKKFGEVGDNHVGMIIGIASVVASLPGAAEVNAEKAAALAVATLRQMPGLSGQPQSHAKNMVQMIVETARKHQQENG